MSNLIKRIDLILSEKVSPPSEKDPNASAQREFLKEVKKILRKKSGIKELLEDNYLKTLDIFNQNKLLSKVQSIVKKFYPSAPTLKAMSKKKLVGTVSESIPDDIMTFLKSIESMNFSGFSTIISCFYAISLIIANIVPITNVVLFLIFIVMVVFKGSNDTKKDNRKGYAE